ncbi:MAG: TonB-dependent receptor [Gammaproteobacteria bacterium]
MPITLNIRSRYWLRPLLMSAAFAAAVPVGYAQGALEEVLVTATRRGATDIQTTPISVTALDQRTLDTMVMQDTSDITHMVPALSNGNAPAFKSFNPSMRGVGKDGIILYVESPVGVAVDDFVLPHVQTQALEPFDIESVEVLRGPQGTLFGKNTTAGVINVRTVQPKLNERTVELRGSYGEENNASVKFAGNYGMDTLAFRVAGIYKRSDGFYENGKVSQSFDPFTFAPVTYAGDGRDLNGDDVFSGRFKIKWAPTDNFEARFTYEIIRDNGDSPPDVNLTPSAGIFPLLGFTGVTSGDPLEQAGVSDRCDVICIEKGHQIDVDGFYLNMDWHIGAFTVNSVTGYREQESRLANTYPGEVYASLFDATRDDDRETFQQEVRFSSNFDGPVNFVSGVFYQEDDTNFCVSQALGLIDFFGPAARPNVALGAAGLPLLATNTWTDNPSVLCNRQDAMAAAIFGDVTWQVTDTFSLGGGVRQSYENKKWAGRAQTFFQFLNGTGSADENLINTLGEPLEASDFNRFPFGVARREASWTNPSWRITVGYEPNDDWFFWMTRSHSVKSGAFNDQIGTFTSGVPTPLTNDRQLAPIDPEFADSIEIGVKADFFNNRMRANLVFFEVDYDDAQRQANTTFTLPGGGSFQETSFFNAAQLNVKGVEFEGSWLVTDGLTLVGNFAYTDAKFERFAIDTTFDGNIDTDLSDRPVNRSPEWMGTVSATYEHGAGEWGRLTHNVMWSYQSGTIFTYSDLGPQFDATLNSYNLVNWSTTFNSRDDRYFVRVFGKNLLDERYRTGNLAVANLWYQGTYAAPRWFGAEAGIRFDF